MQRLIYWFAPVYTLIITYGSLAQNSLPSVAIDNIDKVYHAGAYFVMTVLWYLFFYHRFLEKQTHFQYTINTILSDWSMTIAIAGAVLSLVIGGLIELGQGYFSYNRSMDFYDLLANAAGIIIAVFFLRLISYILR